MVHALRSSDHDSVLPGTGTPEPAYKRIGQSPVVRERWSVGLGTECQHGEPVPPLIQCPCNLFVDMFISEAVSADNQDVAFMVRQSSSEAREERGKGVLLRDLVLGRLWIDQEPPGDLCGIARSLAASHDNVFVAHEPIDRPVQLEQSGLDEFVCGWGGGSGGKFRVVPERHGPTAEAVIGTYTTERKGVLQQSVVIGRKERNRRPPFETRPTFMVKGSNEPDVMIDGHDRAREFSNSRRGAVLGREVAPTDGVANRLLHPGVESFELIKGSRQRACRNFCVS